MDRGSEDTEAAGTASHSPAPSASALGLVGRAKPSHRRACGGAVGVRGPEACHLGGVG